jgi:hypothetical protein
LFTSSKPFISRKTKLAISSQPTTELVVNTIVNKEGHLLGGLSDTDASISNILEAFILVTWHFFYKMYSRYVEY